jgi:Xaa-Pro aminopeptidase
MTEVAVSVFADRRARLLQEMAAEGLDVLLLYGNAWQNDYLRYATDFGILEGQALVIVREDGVTLYLDSALEADRAALECTGIEVVHAQNLIAEVDKALNRLSNRRIGTAPARLIPRKLAARAKDLNLGDRTSFLDRLLMGKLASEVDAIRRACKVADEGYAVFRDAARPGRADYELIAEAEAFFRSKGVDDNFQIIGVGGPEVRGMAPPSGKKLKVGDMVTTELTPCVDGYYAQICRTLVVGEPNAEQNKAFALYREAMEAGIAAVRDGVTAADIARAENDIFRREGLGDYVTDQYTRVRGHGVGLFADTKPHILEDVTTRIDAGMTLIVHPNTYHPVVGYLVLGDVVAVTKEGCEVFTGTPRELFGMPA